MSPSLINCAYGVGVAAVAAILPLLAFGQGKVAIADAALWPLVGSVLMVALARPAMHLLGIVHSPRSWLQACAVGGLALGVSVANSVGLVLWFMGLTELQSKLVEKGTHLVVQVSPTWLVFIPVIVPILIGGSVIVITCYLTSRGTHLA